MTEFDGAIINHPQDEESATNIIPTPEIRDDFAAKLVAQFVETTPQFRNQRIIPKELGVDLAKVVLAMIAKDYIPIPKVQMVRGEKARCQDCGF